MYLRKIFHGVPEVLDMYFRIFKCERKQKSVSSATVRLEVAGVSYTHRETPPVKWSSTELIEQLRNTCNKPYEIRCQEKAAHRYEFPCPAASWPLESVQGPLKTGHSERPPITGLNTAAPWVVDPSWPVRRICDFLTSDRDRQTQLEKTATEL